MSKTWLRGWPCRIFFMQALVAVSVLKNCFYLFCFRADNCSTEFRKVAFGSKHKSQWTRYYSDNLRTGRSKVWRKRLNFKRHCKILASQSIQTSMQLWETDLFLWWNLFYGENKGHILSHIDLTFVHRWRTLTLHLQSSSSLSSHTSLGSFSSS